MKAARQVNVSRKTVLLVICGFFFLLFIFGLFDCGGGESADGPVFDTSGEHPEDFDRALFIIDSIVADTVPGVWHTAGEMPDEGCVKLTLNYPGGRLRTLFNDSNHLHYDAGRQLGINPLMGEIKHLPLRRPLVKVQSNELYYVDNLTYSYPYLIPESKALLDEIATRFHDTLQKRGGGDYRLKVTSLLRTRRSVSRLRRVNRASVDSSAHLFGTTFDISFTRFPYSGKGVHRTQEDLKNLLAEILYQIRNEGKCYVIYEHKPGCFHITVRPEYIAKASPVN